MPTCPIYNSSSACDAHPDCLFLRRGGCAVLLGATIAEDNKKKIVTLESKLDAIDYNLRLLIDAFNRWRR